MEKFSISWRAPEYEHQHKDVDWYWLTLVVTIVLLAISIWQKNFLFTIFIIIAGMALFTMARRTPPVWEFEINDQGIRIGEKKKYLYSHIEGFDIHPDTEEYSKLMLKLRSRLSPYLTIRIPESDTDEIERRLEHVILRDTYEESLVDALSKILKL